MPFHTFSTPFNQVSLDVRSLVIFIILLSWRGENTVHICVYIQGHGFLTVYNGSDLSYKISQLRRNTDYKFRVSGFVIVSTLQRCCHCID